MIQKSRKNKKIIPIISIIVSLLILLIVGIYFNRNNLLRMIVNKKIATVEKEYGLSIKYHTLTMHNLNEIQMQGFSIVPIQRDTLLNMQQVNMRLHLWGLLKREIQVQDVSVNNLNLHFIKKDSVANYEFLFRKTEHVESMEKKGSNYSERVDELLELLFNFLPQNGEIHALSISQRNDSSIITADIPSLLIKDNHFYSSIDISENGYIQKWKTSGELNHARRLLQAKLYSQERKKILLPYLLRKLKAEVMFDTLTCSLSKENISNNEVRLNGKAEIYGLNIYHPALSPEVINLNHGKLSYRINIENQSIELDSSSIVQFNKLQFNPYLRIKKEQDKWHITTSINKSWFPAEELFSSLPQGLFSNLEGIKVSGSLAYHFYADINFTQLDSLKFSSELLHKNFHILKYGATDLGKMSDEFAYTAYENGIPVRTFNIGPSYEHFTPLDSISPLLQMSVLQSEDGAFFYHKGFLPDAMREALIYDLKVKRFARGGSTITMQLVKNVFLNRHKNIARKLEEALIVWLIETEGLTSKHRMYEVYLNIAEWGPLIYGIHEASQYYFNKLPSQLTAEESIFLASIIPKPKHFRSSFTSEMKLKDNLKGYYHLIASRLKAKGLLNEIEADSIRPDINITGPARNDLSIVRDSVSNDASEN